jgi:hypothetical protein
MAHPKFDIAYRVESPDPMGHWVLGIPPSVGTSSFVRPGDLNLCPPDQVLGTITKELAS